MSPRIVFAASLLAACAGKEPANTASGDEAPAAGEVKTNVEPMSPETPDPSEGEPVSGEVDASGPPVVGDWHTIDCGVEYPVELSLADDGSFELKDLVSPCPPNARCMWSGVVLRSGTWSAQGPTVTLTVEGEPRDLQSADMALSEVPSTVSLAHDSLKGANGCLYRKGAADRGFPVKGERVKTPPSK